MYICAYFIIEGEMKKQNNFLVYLFQVLMIVGQSSEVTGAIFSKETRKKVSSGSKLKYFRRGASFTLGIKKKILE